MCTQEKKHPKPEKRVVDDFTRVFLNFAIAFSSFFLYAKGDRIKYHLRQIRYRKVVVEDTKPELSYSIQKYVTDETKMVNQKTHRFVKSRVKFKRNIIMFTF